MKDKNGLELQFLDRVKLDGVVLAIESNFDGGESKVQVLVETPGETYPLNTVIVDSRLMEKVDRLKRIERAANALVCHFIDDDQLKADLTEIVKAKGRKRAAISITRQQAMDLLDDVTTLAAACEGRDIP